MSCDKCTGALPIAGLSRRALLNRFGMGLGGIALANLINPRVRVAAAESQAPPSLRFGETSPELEERRRALSRAPLRRRAPVAWLARHARSHLATNVSL